MAVIIWVVIEADDDDDDDDQAANEEMRRSCNCSKLPQSTPVSCQDRDNFSSPQCLGLTTESVSQSAQGCSFRAFKVDLMVAMVILHYSVEIEGSL